MLPNVISVVTSAVVPRVCLFWIIYAYAVMQTRIGGAIVSLWKKEFNQLSLICCVGSVREAYLLKVLRLELLHNTPLFTFQIYGHFSMEWCTFKTKYYITITNYQLFFLNKCTLAGVHVCKKNISQYVSNRKLTNFTVYSSVSGGAVTPVEIELESSPNITLQASTLVLAWVT